ADARAGRLRGTRPRRRQRRRVQGASRPVGRRARRARARGGRLTTCRILGVVNLTEDSFSAGGRTLDPDRAIAHALALVRDGADAVDLGAAASNPQAKPVDATEEIRRLAPVVAALRAHGVCVSIDSFASDVQRWALDQGVEFLNDTRGFPDPAMHP